MKNLSAAVLLALMVSSALAAGVSPPAGVTGMPDLRGLDLETAMMTAQPKRAELLEGQLKEQIKEVQNRNDEIAIVTEVIASLKAVAAKAPKGAKANTRISGWNDEALRKARDVADKGKLAMPTLLTKGDLDQFIRELKTRANTLSESQQTDMLRLQSLSNKHNEAFELMTNFIKKMQESRSSILGNMR